MLKTATTDAIRIRAVLRLLEHRLHTLSIHNKEHPIHAKAEEALRKAFSAIWSRMRSLPITVTETGLRWEAETVLSVLDDSDNVSLTRVLFDSGIRFLALSPGVEDAESFLP